MRKLKDSISPFSILIHEKGRGGALCYIVHCIILTLIVQLVGDSTHGDLNLGIP